MRMYDYFPSDTGTLRAGFFTGTRRPQKRAVPPPALTVTVLLGIQPAVRTGKGGVAWAANL